MFTISDIVADVERGCAIYNLNEDCFSYRIVFFVNEGNASKKHYVDSTYSCLRQTLEDIIRSNLSLENFLVVAQTTILLNGRCICLQSRSYGFSLDEYFRMINGMRKKGNRNRMIPYGGYLTNARD